MKIELTKQIEVEACITLLDVGIPRDEYRAFLPALILGEESDITPSMINTKLFFTDANDPRGRLLLERLEEYRLVEFSGFDIIEEEEVKEFDIIEGTYDLTPIGSDVIPPLRNYFINLTELDPSIAKIYRSLEGLGFLTADRNPRGLFPTDEIREVGNWLWPKVAINSREIEILKKFSGLGLIMEKQREMKEKKPLVMESKGYKLTETGKAAIQDKVVFIPERDAFILHGTDDPLFSEPILACTKINGNSNDPQLKNKTNGKQKSPPRGQWLAALKERVVHEPKIFHLAAEQNQSVQIIKIDEAMERVDPTFSVFVTLSIDEDEGTILTLYSQSESKKSGSMKGHTVGHEFTLSFIDVLNILFSKRSVDIIEIGDGCALRVSFDEIAKDKAALNNHKKNFDIKQPEIKGFGTFNDVTVKALPVIPRTLDDAEQWAAWTLRESIRYYINEARYMELRERAAKMWEPVYSYDQIMQSLPSFYEIRREYEIERTKNPEGYWFVTAPSLLTIKEGE